MVAIRAKLTTRLFRSVSRQMNVVRIWVCEFVVFKDVLFAFVWRCTTNCTNFVL